MSFQAALIATDRRVYPATAFDFPGSPIGSEVASNERFSFQAVVHNPGEKPCRIAVAAEGNPWRVVVRRVGYVPVRHLNTGRGEPGLDIEGIDAIPGYVPDPLFEESELLLPPLETHAFWVSLYPPEGGVPAGTHGVEVTLTLQEGEETLETRSLRWPVRVHPVTLPTQAPLPITHWFYTDTLMEWYQCTGYEDERLWSLIRRFVTNLVDHGSTMLLVPLFTPPLDGVKRPSQLLRVEVSGQPGEETYHFDWSDVERYLQLAKECGVRTFEWSHLFTQWGVKNAIRIYRGQGRDEQLLWPPETEATSPVYRRFLSQLLPQFHAFLTRHDLLEISYFHISDEPHKEHRENYRAARELIRELAPWMRVMDAMSDIAFVKDGLIDLPIPSLEVAPDFPAAGIESGCYYCCFPRVGFLNRLMETPLAKIGMHGFLFYRWPFRIFLHWGFNYWHKRQSRELIDPFTVQDGHHWPAWAYGDPFVVYPGAEGPLDSIRWEIFAESLQDYALLEAAGVDREDPLLAPLKNFTDFPKKAEWRREARAALFARAQG